jgi:hypothetical protein
MNVVNPEALPPEAILYAMNQTAQAIREAYARVVEHKEPGFFRAESLLPASRDKIKAAIVLSAFIHKLQGQFDKHLHDAFIICYSVLADFVPDEIVERQRKRWELVEAHRGALLKLIKGKGPCPARSGGKVEGREGANGGTRRGRA